MIVIILIAIWHCALILTGLYVAFFMQNSQIAEWQIWANVIFCGLLGGCSYCLRALYIQYCVKKEWYPCWIVWHIIRPTVSCIMGAVSFLFIKAGLLLLSIPETDPTQNYGLYAIAFIAGMNVDNFIKRIEGIFKNVMQIEPTRMSNKPYDESIRLNPEFYEAYYNRGIANSELGKFQDAVHDYDNAIKLNPKEWKVYFARGLAKDKLGNKEGAVTDYAKAKKLNPEFEIPDLQN